MRAVYRDIEYEKTCHDDECNDYTIKRCVPLLNDSNLGETKICAMVIRDGFRTHNRIVFEGPDGEGNVTCVHTAVYEGPISDKPDDAELARTTEFMNVNITPEEHFFSLNSYVEGIANIGLENMIVLPYTESIDPGTLPFGFNDAMQRQVLEALPRANNAAKEMVKSAFVRIVNSTPPAWLEPRIDMILERYKIGWSDRCEPRVIRAVEAVLPRTGATWKLECAAIQLEMAFLEQTKFSDADYIETVASALNDGSVTTFDEAATEIVRIAANPLGHRFNRLATSLFIENHVCESPETFAAVMDNLSGTDTGSWLLGRCTSLLKKADASTATRIASSLVGKDLDWIDTPEKLWLDVARAHVPNVLPVVLSHMGTYSEDELIDFLRDMASQHDPGEPSEPTVLQSSDERILAQIACSSPSIYMEVADLYTGPLVNKYCADLALELASSGDRAGAIRLLSDVVGNAIKDDELIATTARFGANSALEWIVEHPDLATEDDNIAYIEGAYTPSVGDVPYELNMVACRGPAELSRALDIINERWNTEQYATEKFKERTTERFKSDIWKGCLNLFSKTASTRYANIDEIIRWAATLAVRDGVEIASKNDAYLYLASVIDDPNISRVIANKKAVSEPVLEAIAHSKHARVAYEVAQHSPGAYAALKNARGAKLVDNILFDKLLSGGVTPSRIVKFANLHAGGGIKTVDDAVTYLIGRMQTEAVISRSDFEYPRKAWDVLFERLGEKISREQVDAALVNGTRDGQVRLLDKYIKSASVRGLPTEQWEQLNPTNDALLATAKSLDPKVVTLATHLATIREGRVPPGLAANLVESGAWEWNEKAASLLSRYLVNNDLNTAIDGYIESGISEPLLQALSLDLPGNDPRLPKLARNNAKIARTIAGRGDTNENTIRALAARPERNIKEGLLTYLWWQHVSEDEFKSRFPLDVLESLAHDPSPGVKIKLAKWNDLPTSVVNILARDSDAKVIELTMRKHSDKVTGGGDLAGEMTEEARVNLARGTSDVATANILLKDPSWKVRRALVANNKLPNIDGERIKRVLAKDGRLQVRKEVAKRTENPVLVAELSSDATSTVRMAAFTRLIIPTDTLRELMLSGDTERQKEFFTAWNAESKWYMPIRYLTRNDFREQPQNADSDEVIAATIRKWEWGKFDNLESPGVLPLDVTELIKRKRGELYG